MTRRNSLILFACMLISACIQAPAFKGEDYAIIKTNYPIVKVNGVEVERTYSLDLKAGVNTLDIVYLTYRHDYHCSFTWTVEAGTAYEVTDHEKRHPLTLYRWVRANGFWARRLDPLDPVKCTRQPRKKSKMTNT